MGSCRGLHSKEFLSAGSRTAGPWSAWPLRSVGSTREGGPGAGCGHGGEGGDRHVAKARRATAHGVLRFLSGCALWCSFLLSRLRCVRPSKQVGDAPRVQEVPRERGRRVPAVHGGCLLAAWAPCPAGNESPSVKGFASGRRSLPYQRCLLPTSCSSLLGTVK